MKPRRRLFWRLYLFGLLLLLAVSLATGLAVHSLGDDTPFEEMQRRVGRGLAAELGDRANLENHLAQLKLLLGVDLAVLEPDGRVLARTGESVGPPLEEGQRRRLGRQAFFHSPAGWRMALALPDKEAYLLSAPVPGHSPHRLIIALMTILLVLGLVVWPLARSLARPIERLTGTAHALAAGSLEQRSGLERKDEIGSLAQAMDRMADRLQTRIRAERELLSNVSHELRTPLARMRVAIELMEEDGAQSAESTKRLADLGEDLDELEHLIEDVFAIGKLELADDGKGHLPLRTEPVDLKGFCREIEQGFAKRHPEETLQIVLPELPLELEADLSLLRRALDNLLDNAILHAKAPPKSAVELILQASEDGSRLHLDVADRGEGIPAEHRERIFEPFYQADASRATQGRGLGLALCRRIAESHGGSLALLERQGPGSLFRLSLPLTQKSD